MVETKRQNAVRTRGLGKRYGSFWALKDCDIAVPTGSVTALVGENGAGKSTLLQLLAGLNKANAGVMTVLENPPAQTPEFLASIGYLAQDIPLCSDFTANDYLAMGAHLNKTWDEKRMRDHLQELSIPLDRPVGKLSGGQRAQVALGMALAKRPQLLLLDEPVAALDPLARRDFLAALGKMVSEGNLTVLLSSHLLSDIELLCDHLIILKAGQVQLTGEIESIVASHALLIGPTKDVQNVAEKLDVILRTPAEKQTTLLVHTNDRPLAPPPGWRAQEPTVEDVVLAYMQRKTPKGDEQ